MLLSLLLIDSEVTEGQTLQNILTTIQVDEEGELLTEDELIFLEELSNHPINLNSATRRQLEQIPLLTSSEAKLILNLRKKVRQFESIDQILFSQGFSDITYELIPIIFTIRKTSSTKIHFRNRWVMSKEDTRILLQTNIISENVKSGFTLERDPMEPTLTDFASGYVSTSTYSGNTNFLLGDHQINIGYGLLFGRSARTMKNGENIMTITKSGRGVTGYRSSLEYWALRGIAVDHLNRYGRWIVSLTSTPEDATISDNMWINSTKSGLHQTESSLNQKHNLRNQIALLSWKTGREFWEVGITTTSEQWRYGSSNLTNRPYKIYNSVHGRINIGLATIFGEAASERKKRPAFMGGISLIGDGTKWITSYRYYPSGFQGPRSQPFREWTSNKLNESGIYQGISLRIGRHRLNAYSDIYRQITGDNITGSPVQGFETATTWRYRLQKTIISVRWKLEEKSKENGFLFSEEGFPRTSFLTKKQSWRFTTTTVVNQFLKMQIQGDRLVYSDIDSTYWGHSLSLKAHFIYDMLKATLNWVGFVSDDFQSRLYVWDLNLPGEMYSRSFYSTGQSIALLLRFTTRTNATISTRIRSTCKFSRFTGKWYKPEIQAGVQLDVAF